GVLPAAPGGGVLRAHQELQELCAVVLQPHAAPYGSTRAPRGLAPARGGGPTGVRGVQGDQRARGGRYAGAAGAVPEERVRVLSAGVKPGLIISGRLLPYNGLGYA